MDEDEDVSDVGGGAEEIEDAEGSEWADGELDESSDEEALLFDEFFEVGAGEHVTDADERERSHHAGDGGHGHGEDFGEGDGEDEEGGA